MRSRCPSALLMLPLALLAAVPVWAQPPERPQLMVVGTVHFANPGRDAVNTRVEDVLAPSRQAELERLAEALARFRPTHVAVEMDPRDQDRLDALYADWRAGKRATRNELSQIGLRLADRLGLARVDAIDWQGEPPGPESAYDFPAWAKTHDRSAEINAIFAPLQADSTVLEKNMPCFTVSQWLRHANAPDVQRRNARSYYDVIGIGDAKEMPGAYWVGTWHARNLRIWSNLVKLGARPGERILLVIGAGHRPLIEHFARDSGRFDVVDPLRWLPDDRRARREDGGAC